MKSEPMSAIDAAWRRMDSETNAMVITALLTFEQAPEFNDVERLVSERLLEDPRFRQRVVPPALPLGTPSWEMDPHFDLHNHLHRRALPTPGDDRALEELLSELTSSRLDPDRPLWQLHYVERGDRGAAIVARLHHCIGDGVALVRLLLGMTDEGGALPPPPEVGLSPQRPRSARELGELTKNMAKSLGHTLLLPRDAPSALSGALGVQKRAAWSRSFPLAAIKGAAHALSATVNDVLMAALTGALRTHLLEHGGLPEGGEIRALVPVYVKAADSGHGLGNHFGLVYLDLPLAESDPLARVHETQRRTAAIKASPEAMVALSVLGALGVASSEIEHIGIELFTRKATVMVTNVPGPPQTIHLAGKPLDGIMVWAPVAGHIGVGLSLLSYAGQVRLGISTDALRCSDPKSIVRMFEHEIVRLVTSLGPEASSG
ncbi:MAG: wax ester/triacylglycerol synthase family O-acyltransferase [Myxococcales bacterium]|nr:wax ester/triacylglycerol synthase family O-acyltransferase [Myxococcales bacterium]